MTPTTEVPPDRRIDSRPGRAHGPGILPLLATLVLLPPAPHAARASSPDTLFVATGEAARDNLGSAVTSAGDVNGDGYADVIVGAAGNDAGGLDAGRAYVYYGGPGADGVPDLTFTGPSAGIGLGSAVGAAGDVNGDGYGDVVVGAADRAFVFYGGNPADLVADLVLTRVVSLEGFGYSVGTAGDLNGDGCSDVIVGAPANPCDILGRVCQPGEGLKGSAYVYFGGPGADAAPDLTLTGEAEGDHFGASVGTAGDVNGDGYADVIVGAPDNDAAGGLAGRAYVYFGGPGADATADLVLTGAGEGNQFGASVGTAGDVNGDGCSDVIAGAPYNSEDGDKAGRAYVYYGGPAADAAADLTLAGEAPSVYFGVSAGTAGDVNGDGYADVIVGSAHFIAGSGRPGRVCVYFGGPGADALPDLVLTAPADDFFGASVGTAGDVNADGYADLVAGAHGNDAGGADAGRAYVLSLAPPPLEATLHIDPQVIRLAPRGGRVTAIIESSEFDPSEIDLPTVRLAGSVPPESKPAIVGDWDRDGIADLKLQFSLPALAPRLVAGENEIVVTGSLRTGERFRGADRVRAIAKPRPDAAALVAPNPLNPAGSLAFRTSKPGPVRVTLYDLQGRRVRTLLETSLLPAGSHELRIGARGEEGGELASGVYFIRAETPDGPFTGRFAVLK